MLCKKSVSLINMTLYSLTVPCAFLVSCMVIGQTVGFFLSQIIFKREEQEYGERTASYSVYNSGTTKEPTYFKKCPTTLKVAINTVNIIL